ncbi:transglycosylase SLT domain-containing protein [Candidatus Aerophobetes bacterium]|nr:transglycosylase SLT domain-containing protein [Candidatus Aerophobetes bacterium]
MIKTIQKKIKKLIKWGVAGIFFTFLIFCISSPTYIIYYPKGPKGYLKTVEYLQSFFDHYKNINYYYTSLKKDTSFYRLVLSQLKGKEKSYFLQMRPFLSEIVKASQKTGIPISLIASLIKRESQFNPWAVSRKNAYGLMGVTIWAYQDVVRLRSQKKWIAEVLNEYGKFSWEDVKFDPELNIVVGTIYYKFLLNEFKDATLASLAYNWGMGNVSIMQERYGDTESILNRLGELASFNSAWVEPAEYTFHISRFENVFQKVEERIKLAYATYRELSPENLAFLRPAEGSSSS